MKLNLYDIPEQGLEITADISDTPWFRELLQRALGKLLPSEAEGGVDLTVRRAEQMVTVAGHLRVETEPTCDLCLSPFARQISLEIEHFLVPAYEEKRPDKEAKELDEEDLEYGTYRAETIDLAKILREQVILALPIQYSCQESCRGLCPHCGINLNQASCRCHEEHRNSPFAALKSLRS